MIPKWSPGDLAIRASAGYGKTESLCTRLLATFLVDSDAARHTVALTFTRAAASEIYTRMLQMLCEALLNDKKLKELYGKFSFQLDTRDFDNVTRGELLDLLVLLVRDMDEMNISTIDSFFFRLIRVYSVELGLPGAVELLTESDALQESDRLARELLDHPGKMLDQILAAIRQSRLGNEKKSCFDGCRDLLNKVMKFRKYAACPDFWGKRFAKMPRTDRAKLDRALEICRECADSWPHPKCEEKFLPMLEACAAATAETRFNRSELETLRLFLTCLNDFPRVTPPGYKTVYCKDGSLRKGSWEYTSEAAAAVKTLVTHGRDVLLYQCAMRTEALRPLLQKYLELYGEQMLHRGLLNFSDLPTLLSEATGNGPDAEEFLNEIRYRTNSNFRHFLIDEFQDTSRAQWDVLADIVGDNGDGSHSLFIVGDVKQAIYGWREGDSELMGEVAEALKKDRDLDESYRYGSGICEALNHIFGVSVRAAAIVAAGFDPEVGGLFAPVWKKWNGIFKAHRSAVTPPGEFEVLALAPGGPEFTVAAARLILERLDRLQFFKRGLSGGVLVRSKNDGIKLRDTLLALAPGLRGSIVWEGDEKIVNDPLVATLLEFGVWLQYPSDTLARGIVEMNQLMRDILSPDPKSPNSMIGWKNLIAERGVHGFLCGVLSKLNARNLSWGGDPAENWSPVENGNLDTLLALAEKFDASGESRDFRRFRAIAAEAKKPAEPAAGKLRLLTIHHSKGLTFDVVFFPAFDPVHGHGNWKNPEASDVTTGGGKGGEWLLYAPREEGMTDSDIAEAVRRQHVDRCFEELCALYVTLTRARFGMYVYLPPRGRDKLDVYNSEWSRKKKFAERKRLASVDTTYYISDFLFESCFFDPEEFPEKGPLPVDKLEDGLDDVKIAVGSTGDGESGEDGENEDADDGAESSGGVKFLRRSFGSPGGDPRKPPERYGPLSVQFAGAPPRMGRSTPSEEDSGERKLYFTLPQTGSGAMLGTRIHEFFEAVGRMEDFTVPPDTEPEIEAQYQACAANPEIFRLFNENYDELWRERPFDVVLHSPSGAAELVSGCFDRVQIYRDNGGVSRACIIDYKSSQIDDANRDDLVKRYRGQMGSYRRALSKLLDISTNIIDCRIVFTRIGTIAEV